MCVCGSMCICNDWKVLEIDRKTGKLISKRFFEQPKEKKFGNKNKKLTKLRKNFGLSP